MDKDRISYLNDAEHWRKRAEEARSLASRMTDAQTKATMLGIADGYETMAKHAAARSGKAKPPA